MTATPTCLVCDTPLPAEGGACPTCGWDPREQKTVRREVVPPWPDDDDLADVLEQATGGEYEVQGMLGRGGMATVFLAREVALERAVAIKVMAPHVMRSFGMAERFKREAKIAAGLSHPNVIPIYAVRESGPLVCLIMKCLEGRSLDGILRDHRPLAVRLVQTIIRDVAAGLEFAHRNGVVHRDVKPANIMVDTGGQVVVTDFGIAKAREADLLTASGSTIGTPAYMSPEQALGQRASPASDQYSLGVVAYELLAGRMPFIAETAMGLMYQHTHTPPEPLEQVRSDVPPEVARAVDRMLAKNPADRFPTLAEASSTLGVPATLGNIDDPVRRELAGLVGHVSQPSRRSSGAARPRSPISGLTHPSGDPEAPTQPLDTGGARRRRARTLSAVTAILLITGALVAAWLWLPKRVVPPSAPATGTTLAPAAPPATPRASAESLAPRPGPVTPRAPVSAAHPAPPPRVTISRAVDRFRLAVESGELNKVVAAHPAMRADELASYKEFFRTSGSIRFEVIIKDLEQKNGEAEGKLEGFLRFRDRPTGQDRISSYRARIRLADGPTGWRIVEIR